MLNTSRGTNNAGQIAAVLLSLRNPDLSLRSFPIPLGANLPELDTPPWWHLKRKRTMYYDGRTDARSVRTNMQFMLGEKTLEQLKALEPTFRDIQAYLLSLEPPKYPFPIDSTKAERGKAVFEKTCARCHGTYGPGGQYPNKIVPLDVIGTDPARSRASPTGWSRITTHLVGRRKPGRTSDRLSGSAARRHLGDGPLPPQRLGSDPARVCSSHRPGPARFTRPPSTEFDAL